MMEIMVGYVVFVVSASTFTAGALFHSWLKTKG
jgi:hypothetical protein